MAFDLPGQGSPLWETWNMLLNGYGYNWYRVENQMRADDLLVRQKAGYFLGLCASNLLALENGFQRKYLPVGTRENPFPPRDKVELHRQIREVRQEFLSLESSVRSLPVPADDKIWRRHRDEVATISKLTDLDLKLVGAAHLAAENVKELSPEQINDEREIQNLRDMIRSYQNVIEERRKLLLLT